MQNNKKKTINCLPIASLFIYIKNWNSGIPKVAVAVDRIQKLVDKLLNG